jgi:hypothetical protein
MEDVVLTNFQHIYIRANATRTYMRSIREYSTRVHDAMHDCRQWTRWTLRLASVRRMRWTLRSASVRSIQLTRWPALIARLDLKSLTFNLHVDIGASIFKLVSVHPNFVAWVVLDWWMEIQ